MFSRCATNVGGSKSGFTDGARENRTKFHLRREGQGGIFQQKLFNLPPSLFSHLFVPVWLPFHTHREALPLWLRCQRKARLSSCLLCPFCLSSSISVQPSVSPVFSSAASEKCLQITQFWNSTLHLYLYLLRHHMSSGLRVCWVASGRSWFVFCFYLLSADKVVRTTIMVVPEQTHLPSMLCNAKN